MKGCVWFGLCFLFLSLISYTESVQTHMVQKKYRKSIYMYVCMYVSICAKIVIGL